MIAHSNLFLKWLSLLIHVVEIPGVCQPVKLFVYGLEDPCIVASKGNDFSLSHDVELAEGPTQSSD